MALTLSAKILISVIILSGIIALTLDELKRRKHIKNSDEYVVVPLDTYEELMNAKNQLELTREGLEKVSEGVRRVVADQEPVKPIFINGQLSCPRCTVTIVKGFRYCPICGQKLLREEKKTLNETTQHS